MSLVEGIQRLNGNVVTYSRAGGGAGSILLIETDARIELWLWCYWKIKKSNKVLATADDDTTAVVGKIAVAAKQLEGRKVCKVEMDPSCFDLHIFFDEEYELIVNCESQPEGETYLLNNWELAIVDENVNYSVTCNFTIKKESYR